jgi:DNA-binding NarL/FixJ family response regulator
VQILLGDVRDIDPRLESVGQPDSCERSTVIYLDSRALTRECVAVKLAALLPEVNVLAYGDPQDIPSAKNDSVACIVVHTHAIDLASEQASAVLTSVHERYPSTGMIVISDLERSRNVLQAIRLGARAYIPSSVSPEIASEIIRLVRIGGTFIPTSALCLQLDQPGEAVPLLEDRVPERMQFTPRQVEVLTHLWEGKQNKTIAYELDMSESTVKVHVRQIMKKLRATNRTQVVLLTKQLLSGNGTPITFVPDG